VPLTVRFAEDLLGQGVAGLSLAGMREYLQHIADRRLAQLGYSLQSGPDLVNLC
jgi:ribonucleoside-diphosphate reductase beta chain